ncbi:MAG: hypothetical protein N2691_05225 [Patescibacteria group bacterium]|nr:hypothetical protein [Patescibacteria group bacterium]
MKQTVSRTILGQTLTISYFRALFWEQNRTLVIADPHLGQPSRRISPEEELLRLSDAMEFFSPQRLIVLGDLLADSSIAFRASFRTWREQFRAVELFLVKGSRDILSDRAYRDLRVEPLNKALYEGPFVFSHRPMERPVPNRIVICGQVHPAVALYDPQRMPVRYPCFYFGAAHIVLPAFSEAVRLTEIDPAEQDALYIVTERGLQKVD